MQKRQGVSRRGLGAVAVGVFIAGIAGPAAAQICPGGMRKINIGVSASPPNVVHASAYVAKALGLFVLRPGEVPLRPDQRRCGLRPAEAGRMCFAGSAG